MKQHTEAVSRIRRAVEQLPRGRYLLAVSGGRDSMVLMHACAQVRNDIATVATFDHGTGVPATQAAELVALIAAQYGIPSDLQRRTPGDRLVRHTDGRRGASPDEPVRGDSEAELRAARWTFLRRVAARREAQVVTAHTLDDQVETVFMRVLRGAGARGLAGMFAESDVARPLIRLARADVAAYAITQRLRWVDDPSNASPRYLRNRVRHELLPALEKVQPGFSAALLATSDQAASWRHTLADVATKLAGAVPGTVPVAAIAALPPATCAVLWPELASRVGVALDWRGTERLVAGAPNLKPGGRIQLSGGVTVLRTVSSYVIRNS